MPIKREPSVSKWETFSTRQPWNLLSSSEPRGGFVRIWPTSRVSVHWGPLGDVFKTCKCIFHKSSNTEQCELPCEWICTFSSNRRIPSPCVYLCVVDARRQLLGSKAAKDEAVGCPYPGTCQHGKHGLGHHGHVDHHQVSLLHAISHKYTSQPRDLGEEKRSGITRGILIHVLLINVILGFAQKYVNYINNKCV